MAMYVADPHMELVLLIARQAIRLGPIDRIAAWLGRPCQGALARSDVRWLAARTNAHRLAELSEGLLGDRKSTRLNSSHSQISYAVFCLKKKIRIVTYRCVHAVACIIAKA